MEPLKLLPKCGLIFNVLRIDWNTRNRANLHTLRLIKMANAFGALGRVDLVNFWPHKNSLIGAFGLAYITIDALIGNH